MPQGFRPDPRSYSSWQEWAEAESRWVDERIEETINNFRQPDILHKVGDPGEPAYVNGWTHLPSVGGFYFYKDPFGIVHFEGSLKHAFTPSAFHTILQLPPEYRPPTFTASYNTAIPVGGAPTAIGIIIATNGNMVYVGPASTAINGFPIPLTYRAHGFLS